MNDSSGVAPLFDRFFQLGYVTRDGDAAMAQFNQRFGPVEFQVVSGGTPAIKRIALSYVGDTMIEILEVNTSIASFYSDYLSAGLADVRLHHLGYLIDDYPGTLKRLKAEGYDIPLCGSAGDVLDVCYADARAQLGHYLEFIRLGDEGRRWFSSVPGFRSFPAAGSPLAT
jgi:hypothetical protein